MTHRIDVVDSNGAETISNFSKLVYSEDLNGSRVFDVIVEGATTAQKAKLAIDNILNIYKFGSLDVKGVIKRRTHTSSGLLRLQGIGYIEQKLKDANAPDASWSSTDTSGVVNDEATNILANVDTVTAGTLEDQTVESFRTHPSQTCFYAIYKLLKMTGQDWQFDDTNNELDILDHKGSSTSVGTMNEGIDIDKVTWEEDAYESVKKVTVIGKNEGGNQVSGTYSSGWSQGDPEITIVDKSIDTDAEAEDRATKEYAARSGTGNTYSFEVLNQAFTFVVGDVITLNAPSANISDTNVRVTSRKWVVVPGDRSQLYMQVRATTDREAASDRLSIEQERRRAMDDANSLKQGTDNAASVTGITGDVTEGPSVTGVTGQVTDGPSDTSISGGIDVEGGKGTGYQFGPYTLYGLTKGSWTNAPYGVNRSSSKYFFHVVYGAIYLWCDGSGSGMENDYIVLIRVKNTTDNTYFPDSDGMYILYFFNKGQAQGFNLPFSLTIPEDWASKTYYLQYFLSNYSEIAYSDMMFGYAGTAGHDHDDDFDTDDDNHSHADSFDTSDSNHPHSDTFDTSDSDHSH